MLYNQWYSSVVNTIMISVGHFIDFPFMFFPFFPKGTTAQQIKQHLIKELTTTKFVEITEFTHTHICTHIHTHMMHAHVHVLCAIASQYMYSSVVAMSSFRKILIVDVQCACANHHFINLH